MSQGLRSNARSQVRGTFQVRSTLQALGSGTLLGALIAVGVFLWREPVASVAVSTPMPLPPVSEPSPSLESMQWLDWSAQQQAQQAQLQWATGFERDCHYFQIERAGERDSFAVIGRIPANGSSSMVHTYRFTDSLLPASLPDTLRYRLRQVGATDDSRLSQVISLPWQPRSADLYVHAHPNPAYKRFEVVMQGQGAHQMDIMTPDGQTVNSRPVALNGSSTLAFDARKWDKGLYLIRLTGPQGRKTTGVWVR